MCAVDVTLVTLGTKSSTCSSLGMALRGDGSFRLRPSVLQGPPKGRGLKHHVQVNWV